MTLDTRVHAATFVQLLTAAMPDESASAYQYGEVPGEDGNPGVLPDRYAIVQVERRFNGDLRASGETDVTLWRLTVRHVGRTVNEAGWVYDRVSGGLNEASIVIGSRVTGPIQFELDQAAEPDSGRMTGRSQWTYNL